MCKNNKNKNKNKNWIQGSISLSLGLPSTLRLATKKTVCLTVMVKSPCMGGRD
jgi:hypothetical protein